MRLIKDGLLNLRSVNNEYEGNDYCSYYILLYDNERILYTSNSSNAEIIEILRTTSRKNNSSLQNTPLNKGLDAFRTYVRGSINISKHSEFANEFADTIREKICKGCFHCINIMAYNLVLCFFK